MSRNKATIRVTGGGSVRDVQVQDSDLDMRVESGFVSGVRIGGSPATLQLVEQDTSRRRFPLWSAIIGALGAIISSLLYVLF